MRLPSVVHHGDGGLVDAGAARSHIGPSRHVDDTVHNAKPQVSTLLSGRTQDNRGAVGQGPVLQVGDDLLDDGVVPVDCLGLEHRQRRVGEERLMTVDLDDGRH